MRRFVLLLAAATALSAAELYRVAGVVVDSETGSPVANASVALAADGQTRGDMVATTGPDGRFSFDAPLGMLRLSAVVAGRSEVFGDLNAFLPMGCAVITGPDRDTAHLVFRWFRPAVIAGRVVDDQGEPVENAAVQLFYSGVVAGHARITEASYASTNDRGEYRVWGIAGAAYYVGVTADPWYVRSGAFDQSSAQPAYAAVYYPGTTDVTRATPLKVQPGEEAHADFTLTPVAASAVTVNCDNDAAHADSPSPLRAGLALNVIAHGIGGIETILKERFGDCPLAVNGLLPGHYLLRLSDTESTIPRAAQRWIDVGAGDMTVSLSLHPAAAVRGKVAIKNAGARPGEMTVRLYRELDEWSDTVAVGADGTFSFPHIEPGKYQVYAFGPGYYTEAIRAGDVVLFGGVVNVEDGVESRLSIVVSNESGRMKGFATRDDQPIANMLVVLVPRNRANAYTNVGYQTDSDGSFDWSDIRAGDYLLFAVDDPTIAYADAAAVKLYLAQAKAIRIESGKVLEEHVPVQAAVK